MAAADVMDFVTKLRASGEFEKIFDTMARKASSGGVVEGTSPTPFSEITDDDIDALFSD